MIIQTHLADHPLLVQLTDQGYFAFAEQALSERRAAGLPPLSHLALLRAEAQKPGQAEAFLDEACTLAEQTLAAAAQRHRAARSGAGADGASRRALPGAVAAAGQRPRSLASSDGCLGAAARAATGGRAVRWSLDVDPIDLF